MESTTLGEMLQAIQEYKEADPEQNVCFILRKHYFAKLQEGGMPLLHAQTLAQKLEIQVTDEAYQEYKETLFTLVDALASSVNRINNAYLEAGMGALQDPGVKLVLE